VFESGIGESMNQGLGSGGSNERPIV
jgi:hypothetical protein